MIPLPPLWSTGFLDTAVYLLVIAVIIVAILALFQSTLFNQLSTRITMLVMVTGLAAILLAFVFNEATSDTLSPPWLRELQIAALVLGGPIMLGFIAARLVRRPLRQFNEAVASLKKNNYKVQLQPSGIREFDEVFSKFNDLIIRLRNEEKLRKDLVSDTSHELNTPLTAMIGQLTAMQEDKHALTKERVHMLKEQAERLAELVRQLDTYTKARMPSIGEPEDIPLRTFCKELTHHFAHELTQKDIEIELDIAADVTIHTNRSVLQQILTNLMQNALRYSGASKITIAATNHKLVFSDNGQGVPEESLPYLFERFYRVDKSRSRETGGLGLGLAIVRELVEAQNWHIRAESAQPGLRLVLEMKP